MRFYGHWFITSVTLLDYCIYTCIYIFLVKTVLMSRRFKVLFCLIILYLISSSLTELKQKVRLKCFECNAQRASLCRCCMFLRVGPSHLLWVWGAGYCSTQWPRWRSPPPAAAEPDGSVTLDPRPHRSYERCLCACSATWAFYREEE